MSAADSSRLNLGILKSCLKNREGHFQAFPLAGQEIALDLVSFLANESWHIEIVRTSAGHHRTRQII
jgi:hypothetical protein